MLIAFSAAFGGLAVPVFVSAQAVVQPLPPQGASNLNQALRRLARNSNNVSALIDAGNASLEVNDIDAAIGFFGRAEELSPGNARIKLGLAAAYIRKLRPLDALRLFDEAEKAGVAIQALSGDRGLAYDLVGDNNSARQQYLSGLSQGDDVEILQRLAINHAISGDRASFEFSLAPLERQNQRLASRIRIFGLAILGDEAGASDLAGKTMRSDQFARIAPYLRYMPQLTRAQQAAAANLGIFPTAARVGRDAPRIAQYDVTDAKVPSDARLAPQGQPLGPRPVAPSGPVDTDSNIDPSTDLSTPAQRSRSSPANRSRAAGRYARTETDPLTRTRVASRTRVARSNVPSVSGVRIGTQNGNDAPVQPVSPASEIIRPEPITTPVVNKVSPTGEIPAAYTATSNTAPDAAAPTVQNVPSSVAAAFANFDTVPPDTASDTAIGVDITAIEPPREQVVPVAVEPELPRVPRRFWAQVATGRDRAALAFDWRRIRRKADDILEGKDGFVARWGQTNRLLSGPFDSSRAAAAAVAELKAAGIDSFAFTSAEGEEVQPIQ